MDNIKSELLPDHKVFTLSDGRKIGAHKHSCLFCNHCTDIFWDYTNGIYALVCGIKWNNAENMNKHINLSFRGKCKSFEENDMKKGG